MIQVKAFAFTAYPITDLARSRAFYEKLLGLKPATTWEGDGKGWIEYELGDGCLAITNSSGDQWKASKDGPAVALEVADFPAAIAACALPTPPPRCGVTCRILIRPRRR